ncbi:alpha/beta fold hydrolase [Salinivibrio sharmensis]|uniref:Alpha/beta hydrolase n=1 Tax=Salinivibrio sharmensis TaxID=390883 RepID=A0ABX3KKS4_9GAMM|nr:alpha/beta fold hydrolase [Salinivibrio sharmensis]OOE90807.1 alpha/beta hydrolase [Salinivibrio sharmensis]
MLFNGKSRGEGSPLVLIHGLFGDLDNLGGLAKTLADHFCVYQIDLPNHGRSYHTESTDYQSQSDAVVAWMDGQQLESAIIVGHSMGGKVAMAVAQRFPERVEQLVVMDIAPVDYQVSRHDNVFKALHQTQRVTLKSRQQAQTIMNESIENPGVSQFLLKSLYKTDHGHYAWRFNIDNLYHGYRDIMGWTEFGQYSGPTLFVKGQNSEYILPDHREAIVAQFPHSKAHMVAGTGHWLHAEKPAVVASVIERFLMPSER